MPSVEIALATCNGAQYLADLLISLFRQTWPDFRLIVADDNSEDETVSVVAQFHKLYPDRVRVVGFSDRSGGATANFARLVDHLSADYILFADQDDVWLPNKIQNSLNRIQLAEARYGATTPILVHTDLAVVDAKMNPLCPSFWRSMTIDPRRKALREILLECNSVGCTMMANRALYELARPIPPTAMLHDHWFALVASAFGVFEYMPEPTVLYRRHEGNASVQRFNTLVSALQRGLEILTGRTTERDRGTIFRLASQAAVFLDRYGSRLGPEQRRIVQIVADLPAMTGTARCSNVLRNRILRTGFLRNLVVLYLLLGAIEG